jgi:hypothetical protein
VVVEDDGQWVVFEWVMVVDYCESGAEDFVIEDVKV